MHIYISNWAFFGCSQSCLCFLNMSISYVPFSWGVSLDIPFSGVYSSTDLILNWVLKLNSIKQEINSNKNYLDCLERALFILFTPFIETRPWTIASMEVLNEGERSKLVSKFFLLFDINMKKRRSSGNKVP